MPRPHLGDHGRTAAAKPCVFRLSVAERRWLEAEAARAGVRVNELARRRTLGFGDDGQAPTANESTDSPKRSTESGPRELAVEYDT